GGDNRTLAYRRDGAGLELVGAVEHSEPHGLWASPDGSRLYVSREKSDVVDVVDTAELRVVANLPSGQFPGRRIRGWRCPEWAGDDGPWDPGPGTSVENLTASVDGVPQTLAVTVRALDGLDMVQVAARGLAPGEGLTLFGIREAGERTPLVRFTANDRGAVPQALAFTTFFGVYEGVIVIRTGHPSG
ncbi:MAG: hypothetical protein ACRDV9_00005, partial [Acidimicrobiia bacterium]